MDDSRHQPAHQPTPKELRDSTDTLNGATQDAAEGSRSWDFFMDQWAASVQQECTIDHHHWAD